MKKIYHLGNCTTCQAIMNETGIDRKGFVMQDIKFEKITPAQLDGMKSLTGSYEALFSRRALKYKELGLKVKKPAEKPACRQAGITEVYIGRIHLSETTCCNYL